MRLFASLSVCILLLSGCAGRGGPGSVHVAAISDLDGTTQFVTAAPGWVAEPSAASVGLLGGPFKVGATVAPDYAMLLVRLEHIHGADELELMVGTDRFRLQRFRRADVDVDGWSSDGALLGYSETRYSVERAVLDRMVAGERVIVRVEARGAVLEGDFGVTCRSRWPDRACVGITKMLEEAARLGF